MKLVSFDVGLRNLSVCILEGTNRSDCQILHWDLIDVMAEVNGHDKPLCQKCKKPAMWVQTSTETYTCTTHKPKRSAPPTKTALTKRTIESLRAEASAVGVAGTTKQALVNGLYTHYRATAWTRCAKSCKQGSVVDLAPAIARSFQARMQLWKGADWVIFEQQPDKRMMAVQAMMHMWFVCQGFACKGISAIHKLTNVVTADDATKTYKGRKKTGILHSEHLVPTEAWKAYMRSHPKQDDLCDAFLGGLWFLEHNS
jgi:hypothetical protein